MSAPLEAPRPKSIDLTAPGPLAKGAERLSRLAVPPEDLDSVVDVTSDEHPRRRSRRLGELLLKRESGAALGLLKAAGKLAVQLEPAGLRLLLGFLEVKRPGAEVLHQLRGLSSIRRVSLRLLSGRFRSPKGGDTPEEDESAEAFLEAIAAGVRLGIHGLSASELPPDRPSVVALHRHLKAWFDRTARQLEGQRQVPEETLHFITRLAMLEVSLLEMRVSRIARTMDPGDTGTMGLLHPVIARYDQDIEHMKDVVPRLSTYEPFRERTMTIERTISTPRLDELIRLMSRDVMARCLARVVVAMRRRPILDREFTYQISQLYQIGVLRGRALGTGASPDLLSVMLAVLESRQDDASLTLSLEPDVADAIWPVVETWGARRMSRRLIETRVREMCAHAFIARDGTPELPEHPQEQAAAAISLAELVRREIENEPFILGVLDNPKVSAAPGIVPFIARESRSVRVLEKIIRVPRLHTGDANRDVPRLLLLSPAHIPPTSLRRFIHVRFVSRTDLRKMARTSPDVRPEVSKEVAAYLRTL